MRKLKIVTDGTPHGTRLMLDEEELKIPVTDIQMSISANEPVIATITIVAPEIEFETTEDKIEWAIKSIPKIEKPKGFFGNIEKSPPKT